MAKIIVKEGESIDSAIKRFKKACNKEHLQEEINKRCYYEKPSEKKRRKKNAAVSRQKQISKNLD